jgi:hypothetical protein
MEEDKIGNQFLALFLFLTLIIITVSTGLYFHIEKTEENIVKKINEIKQLETSKLKQNLDPAQRYWNGTHSSYPSGIYIPNCGFFVDTRGRLIEDINRTVNHESLHALIEQDEYSRQHFCGEIK